MMTGCSDIDEWVNIHIESFVVKNSWKKLSGWKRQKCYELQALGLSFGNFQNLCIAKTGVMPILFYLGANWLWASTTVAPVTIVLSVTTPWVSSFVGIQIRGLIVCEHSNVIFKVGSFTCDSSNCNPGYANWRPYKGDGLQLLRTLSKL